MTSSDADLIALYERVNNTGKWGVEDELGTLNHITPAKRVAAAQLVRTGDVVSLAHAISQGKDDRAGTVEHRLLYGRPPEDVGVPWSAGDRLRLETHAASLTHVDCVSHIASHEHRVYNGRDFDAVAAESGITQGSVFAQRAGIVTRGVLLDVPAALGLPWVPPDEAVTAADLEAAEIHAGVRVERGDVLVLRVGRSARLAAEAKGDGVSPGPSIDAIAWLHEREIAAYAGDAPDRVTQRGAAVLAGDPTVAGSLQSPSRFIFPLHQIGIPSMGLILFDHCSVEDLAAACHRLGRWEFMFVAAPLPIRGGTGSAVNPLAIF